MAERQLDVSALEPPEPLVLTLSEAAGLRPGEYLRMLHRRQPLLLYKELEELGFSHETRVGSTAACEVFIWRSGDREAEAAANAAASGLLAWQE